jgi:hypothetical protein
MQESISLGATIRVWAGTSERPCRHDVSGKFVRGAAGGEAKSFVLTAAQKDFYWRSDAIFTTAETVGIIVNKKAQYVGSSRLFWK